MIISLRNGNYFHDTVFCGQYLIRVYIFPAPKSSVYLKLRGYIYYLLYYSNDKNKRIKFIFWGKVNCLHEKVTDGGVEGLRSALVLYFSIASKSFSEVMQELS